MTHFATSCRIGALLLLCACLRVCRKMCAKKNEKKNEKSPSGDFNFFSLPFFFSSLSPSLPFSSILGRFLLARGLGKVSISISPPGIWQKRSTCGVLFRFTPRWSPWCSTTVRPSSTAAAGGRTSPTLRRRKEASRRRSKRCAASIDILIHNSVR